MLSFGNYTILGKHSNFIYISHIVLSRAFEFPTTHTQKLLGTSDVWQHAINSDEVSPALLNVVDEISVFFTVKTSFKKLN